MCTHDNNGREYARLECLKAGDTVEVDLEKFHCFDSCDCITIVRVDQDQNLFIECIMGEHYLDGFLTKSGHLEGIYPINNLFLEGSATHVTH